MSKLLLDEYEFECNLMDEYLEKSLGDIKDKYEEDYNKDSIFENICERYSINDKVKKIAKMKQFKQRSDEWFAQRKKMISASDMASVFSIGYSSKKQLMEKKVLDNSTFKGNIYTKWGQKYEDIASIIYEKRKNVRVLEFGLIQHSKYDFIGASPDGITTDGVMLEIKCPSKRVITGITPEHYGVQMQIQLEVCELDECDFCEIKFSEYGDEEEYLSSDNGDLEKGVLVSLKNIGDEDPLYIYPKSYMLGDDKVLFKWRDEVMNKYKDKYKYIKCCYWYVEVYCCVTVKRDKKWFNDNLNEIRKFWEEILYYRENLEEYYEKYPKKKKKNVVNLTSMGKKSSFHDEIYSNVSESADNVAMKRTNTNTTKKQKVSSFHSELYDNNGDNTGDNKGDNKNKSKSENVLTTELTEDIKKILAM